jgi:hypothetical protein
VNFTNIFKNIRTLDISSNLNELNYDKHKFKINLPKIRYLSICHSSDLENFNELKLLRRIFIENFDIFDKIAEVFDPSQIIDLKISFVGNPE